VIRLGTVKLPVSTEWVLHCATTLAQLDPGASASAAQLAEYYDLPAAYLVKQLKTLVRAGVLAATTGPRGGFRLARPPAEITLLQIVEAVDGTSSPYECREIRQQGRGALPPEECRRTCVLAEKMADAHDAWRHSLAAVTLADILATLPPTAPSRTRARLMG
jgi:Rrf2 family protein